MGVRGLGEIVGSARAVAEKIGDAEPRDDVERARHVEPRDHAIERERRRKL